MVDRALAFIGLAGTMLFWALPYIWRRMPKRWAYVGVGASAVLLLIGAGLLFLPAGAQQPAAPGVGVQQNNQNGPNFSVPGSNPQFFFFGPQQPQNSQNDPDHIWQDGTVVATAVGGRRSPTDASQFLFVEITHAQQFNPGRTFHYKGQQLALVHYDGRVGLDSSRPGDGTVYTNLIAKIYDAK
jgi:hypothetical protein